MIKLYHICHSRGRRHLLGNILIDWYHWLHQSEGQYMNLTIHPIYTQGYSLQGWNSLTKDMHYDCHSLFAHCQLRFSSKVNFLTVITASSSPCLRGTERTENYHNSSSRKKVAARCNLQCGLSNKLLPKQKHFYAHGLCKFQFFFSASTELVNCSMVNTRTANIPLPPRTAIRSF